MYLSIIVQGIGDSVVVAAIGWEASSRWIAKGKRFDVCDEVGGTSKKCL